MQETTIPYPVALRQWAKGMYTTEAGTELLLRAFGGRFARPGNRWIVADEYVGYWINWAAIEDNIGGLSGGERRVLRVAASLGGDLPVRLGDVVAGVDRGCVVLILAAVAHASGSHQHSRMDIDQAAGTYAVRRLTSLYPWPELTDGEAG